jgi:LmbE family N-acetylglucosaminyl deacetylase
LHLTSVNDISTKHRHIFLAPHFDDVVYSCGGTLGVQVSSGLTPLVITVFGGLPPAQQQLSPLALRVFRSGNADVTQGAEKLMEKRRQEDEAALNYLQVDYLWLDYQEAIFRGNPPTYNSREELIGGEVAASDQAIDHDLAQTLLSLQSRLPDAAWYAPLGVGRHVDHQIVCSAADRLMQAGAKVYFYEDLPYVTRQPGALEQRLNELGGAFEPNLVEVSEFLPARQEAAEMYQSQISANFVSKEAMFEAIDNYAYSIRPVETVRLERYWTTAR